MLSAIKNFKRPWIPGKGHQRQDDSYRMRLKKKKKGNARVKEIMEGPNNIITPVINN